MLSAVSEAWRSAYPGASAGILVIRGAANWPQHPELTRAKRDLEETWRQRLQGPDDRTAITPGTHDVVYAVYAPEGILPEAVHRHLEDIAANVRLVSPEAQVESLDVYTA